MVLLLLTFVALMGRAEARLLLLESALSSHVPLGPDARRFELGSEYFSGGAWAGQRHLLRYAGSREEQLSWFLSLPWLYSSYQNSGHGGRDNIHVGGAMTLGGGLRLGGDLWLPFTDDALYPLAQRRAFGRLALLGDWSRQAPAKLPLSGALSYRRELKGLGPDSEGPVWSDLIAVDLRLGRRLGATWECFLGGNLSHAFDEDLSWGDLSAGLGLGWGESWRMEFSGALALALASEPEDLDYAFKLRLHRDITLPRSSELGDPPAGEEPDQVDPAPPDLQDAVQPKGSGEPKPR